MLSLSLAVGLQAANTQTEQQFIASAATTVAAFQSSLSLPPVPGKVVLSGNLVYANGALVTQPGTLSILLQYAEGLKAAGAQRIDLNPGVTSINNSTATAVYDGVVAHLRELGLQLALNPQLVVGELGASPTFQDFETIALVTYPALAARYQPDNFVIVHEPTTFNARLGVDATPAEWDGFIRAVAPLIQKVSPHTRLGAGDFYDAAENAFFLDFLTIPVLDFMTMDVYDDRSFPQLNGWIQLAHAAVDPTHPNGKGIYMEETWAPKYLPSPLPPGWQANPQGLDGVALVGACNVDFAALDAAWLQAMVMWASASGMEAVTPFTTEAFFYYGPAGHDKPFDPVYLANAYQDLQNGQLTATGKAYLALKAQYGISETTSISSASYATVPSVFTPYCGSAADPCDAQTVIAPDELVSAFGVDLATTTALDGSFPTTLGGTTATLVDSSNTSYPMPLFFVAGGQVNYYVPAHVKAGPAILTVKSGDGTQTIGSVMVSSVMPGLYTANQNGQGAPSAIAIVAHDDGSQSSQLTYTCAGGAGCGPAPISLTATDALYIELFGTGIRHVSALSAATATVNGQSVAVQYAGPSSYAGEDQVNIQIPPSLFNAGQVSVVVTLDGQASNAVTLELQ